VTAYTLFSQAAPTGTIQADTGAYTMGIEFSVSADGTLAAIWWYSPAAAPVLPASIGLYAVSGQALVHSEAAAWSGAAGSGWVRAAFASPPSLAGGASYRAVVLKTGAANHWYVSDDNYWTSGAGSGGVTSGPLSAPSNGGSDVGQDSFNASGTLAYPATSGGGSNYWLDPEVTVTAPAPAAPAAGGAAEAALMITLGVI
jgi:hypothetical protein